MNFKVTRVSYPGYGATVTALMGGEIDSATVPIPDTIGQHAAGKLKLSASRRPNGISWPPISRPSSEQGFDVVVGSWRCLIGPKGMPADRLAILEKNIIETLKDPEFLAKAKQAGFIVRPRDSKATQALEGR